MTQAPTTEQVPQFDLADRMRKALRHADIGVQDMADYLEVSRNTVGTWINGRNKPSPQTVRLWALRCGVPFEWLRHGIVGALSPQPGGDAVWAPRGSNPEPADYKFHSSRSVVTPRSDIDIPRPVLPRRRPRVPAEPRTAVA